MTAHCPHFLGQGRSHHWLASIHGDRAQIEGLRLPQYPGGLRSHISRCPKTRIPLLVIRYHGKRCPVIGRRTHFPPNQRTSHSLWSYDLFLSQLSAHHRRLPDLPTWPGAIQAQRTDQAILAVAEPSGRTLVRLLIEFLERNKSRVDSLGDHPFINHDPPDVRSRRKNLALVQR